MTDTLRTHLPEHYAVLLTTYKKVGTPVSSPVNLVIDEHGTGWFITEAESGKVKRLRHTTRVLIAPCTTWKGRSVGEAVEADAVQVDGSEKARARKLLRGKYPIVHRFVLPLVGFLKRETFLCYRVSDPRPVDAENRVALAA